MFVRGEVGFDPAQVCQDLGFLRANDQLPVAELPDFEPEEAKALIDGDDAGLFPVERETPCGEEDLDFGITCLSRASFDGANARK